jgi:dGTPase
MEAAQISRTIAKALRLNEDLAEAVALSHDLGHTPFGHAGERVLNTLMADHGGFEHNAQSLRIVDELEERYPDFRGLNLSWEVREGIVKHSPPYDKPLAANFDSGAAPALEAQLVDHADEIAYNSHDIDDGLKSGLIEPAQLESVRLWRDAHAAVRARFPGASPRIQRYQAIRRLIDTLVNDLIATVEDRLRQHRIVDLDGVRAFGTPLAGFSDDLDRQRLELKAFLMEHMYRHYRVMRMAVKAQRVMAELFASYMGEPTQLPPHILARYRSGQETLARVVADYIAGMTDRFALEDYRKLVDPFAKY